VWRDKFQKAVMVRGLQNEKTPDPSPQKPKASPERPLIHHKQSPPPDDELFNYRYLLLRKSFGRWRSKFNRQINGAAALFEIACFLEAKEGMKDFFSNLRQLRNQIAYSKYKYLREVKKI